MSAVRALLVIPAGRYYVEGMPFVKGDRIRLRRDGRTGTVEAVRMNGYQIAMDDNGEVEFWRSGQAVPLDAPRPANVEWETVHYPKQAEAPLSIPLPPDFEPPELAAILTHAVPIEPMLAKPCPLDGADSELLTTMTEYRYQCIKCGSRFNEAGEIQPTWDEESVEDQETEEN